MSLSVTLGFFIWLSFLKMSLSICHCKSEWEYFATQQSLQQENQLYEFLHNVQQAKADDSTWAPGDTR